MQLQLELRHGVQETIDFLEPHCAFFTFAENYGNPDCRLPVQRPLPLPPDAPAGRARLLAGPLGRSRPTSSRRSATGASTGATSPSRASATPGASTTSSSSSSTCPQRTGQPLRAGAEQLRATPTGEMLREHGWRVRDGARVLARTSTATATTSAARAASSPSPRTRTCGCGPAGSATAAPPTSPPGRPVITQDTGFSNVLPTGEGLFALRPLDEAAAAVEAIDADYARHARAAARDRARVLRPRGRARRAARATSASTRAARHPAAPRGGRRLPGRAGRSSRSRAGRRRCRAATVEAAPARRSRATSAPPALGAGSASIVVVTHDSLAFTRLCLESVLANTGDARYELIVVDNGSSDGTPRATCARLAERDARVARRCSTARNRGFAAACNQGLALAARRRSSCCSTTTRWCRPGWLGAAARATCATRRSAWSARSPTGSATRPRSTTDYRT